jgi:trk system potassium uptake protein TrkA
MLPYQYIIIVGCGRLGSMLANRLSGLGSSVVVIDQNEAAFNNLSAEFSGFCIVGDAAELAVLRQAKTDKADCFLATTQQDNINLMVAQVAKVIFKVPKVMARIFNPAREPVYRQFGLETISPTQLSAELFLKVLQGEAELR